VDECKPLPPSSLSGVCSAVVVWSLRRSKYHSKEVQKVFTGRRFGEFDRGRDVKAAAAWRVF